MKFVLQPWQILLFILAGWINRHQQNAIEYLLTENRILREKLGKKRILLNDDQRRRLAIKGKILGRKVLGDLCTIVKTGFEFSAQAFAAFRAGSPESCNLRT